MKTKDVIKTGIDRNFLRKCIEQGIIKPRKHYSSSIIHYQYFPREYTQEDVEAVWNAYLYRKMGLSYGQIKELRQGNEINLRLSLNNLIKKYEDEIEELQALILFMKYVKTLGFIPDHPQELMGSQKFKDYLLDFMNYIDEKGVIKKSIPVISFFAEADNIENLNESDLSKLNSIVSSILPHFSEDDRNNYSEAFIRLSQKAHEPPAGEEVQGIINDIYVYQKRIAQNPDMTAWSFAMSFLNVFVYNSDITAFYKKTFGEEIFDFFISALVEFLKINEPKKVEELLEKHRGNNNE